MFTRNPLNYLHKYGPDLENNGYKATAVPARAPASFALPGLDLPLDARSLSHPLQLENDTCDVALSGCLSPLVHLNTDDPTIFDHMVGFVEQLVGSTVRRDDWRDQEKTEAGFVSGAGLVFRAEVPFKSVSSMPFLNQRRPHEYNENQEFFRKFHHSVTVLGADASWKALGTNPQTGRPFRWKDKQGPHSRALQSLPSLTEEAALAICEEFNQICRSRGWMERGDLRQSYTGQIESRIIYRLHLNQPEFGAVIEWSPAFDDHLTWVGVGIELWKDFAFSDHHYDIWRAWTSAVGFDVDYDDLLNTWDKMDWTTERLLKYFRLQLTTGIVQD